MQELLSEIKEWLQSDGFIDYVRYDKALIVSRINKVLMAEGLKNLPPAAPKKPNRFQVTDDLGNIAYIHNSPHRGWCCVLANGIPAAFSCAVGTCNETMFKFRLEDADTDGDRLAIIKAAAGPRRTVVTV